MEKPCAIFHLSQLLTTAGTYVEFVPSLHKLGAITLFKLLQKFSLPRPQALSVGALTKAIQVILTEVNFFKNSFVLKKSTPLHYF